MSKVELEKYNTKGINNTYNSMCYDYVSSIYQTLKKITDKKVRNDISKLNNLFSKFDLEYNDKSNYGDMYIEINELLKKNIKFFIENPEFHDFIVALYENENKGLEIAHESFKKEKKGFLNKIINLSKKNSNPNKVSPSDSESNIARLNSVIGKYVVANTNIPNSKNFSHKSTNDKTKEIRMGCQIEKINDKTIVNPLYLAYLHVKKKNNSREENQFETVYFNLLRRDPEGISKDDERKEEGVKTKNLEGLNDIDKGIAVITLPADENFLNISNFKSTEIQTLTNTIEKIIYSLEKNQDFYIDDSIKKILTSDSATNDTSKNFNVKMRELLKKSAEHLGLINNEATITASERHALMFHFIKYELTNFIIEKLKPKTYNFTCKDGIDRGAAHSLYYNTMKSISDNKADNSNKVISDKDFLMHLDAAAFAVKGRKMNKHRFFIANAINLGSVKNDSIIPDHLKKWSKETIGKAPGILGNVASILISSFKSIFFEISRWWYKDKNISEKTYGQETIKNLNARKDILVSPIKTDTTALQQSIDSRSESVNNLDSQLSNETNKDRNTLYFSHNHKKNFVASNDNKQENEEVVIITENSPKKLK